MSLLYVALGQLKGCSLGVVTTKVCSCCHTEKDLSEFYPRKAGYESRCKICIGLAQTKLRKIKAAAQGRVFIGRHYRRKLSY